MNWSKNSVVMTMLRGMEMLMSQYLSDNEYFSMSLFRKAMPLAFPPSEPSPNRANEMYLS